MISPNIVCLQQRTELDKLSWLLNRLALAICLLLGALILSGCQGQKCGIPVGPESSAQDASFRFIKRWDIDKLNQILTVSSPEFFGDQVSYTPATNAVDLYYVEYNSSIPEKNNRPTTATGLLAVPVLEADRKPSQFPVVSYQHGTVYRKSQVPSNPMESPETQLMIAQFAGQGYVVIAADYFGMGGSKLPQGYLVKESHQQACYDMLQAALHETKKRGLTPGKLYLTGWSQGGFVTLALSQFLEDKQARVAAVATASAPSEGFGTLAGFLLFPRPIDANWVNCLYILTAFSFEEYYNVPGLGRALIQEKYYQICRDFYDDKSVDFSKIPTDLKQLIRPEYFEAKGFESSAYGNLLKSVDVNQRIVRTPTQTYYGGADEVITPGMGQLVETYQKSIGSGNTKVKAVYMGDDATHHSTFARAVPHWKKWFDSLNKN